MEKIVLATAVAVDPGSTTFAVTFCGFDWESQLVIVRFRECDSSGVPLPNGRVYNVKVTGYDALLALNSLEKANFTTVSFKTRLVQWLQQHGTPPYLPGGNITGNPDVPVAPV